MFEGLRSRRQHPFARPNGALVIDSNRVWNFFSSANTAGRSKAHLGILATKSGQTMQPKQIYSPSLFIPSLDKDVMGAILSSQRRRTTPPDT